MSLLIRSEIFGVFTNTLTADDKYSHHNKENLQELIPMQISKKSKTFFEFFIPFLKFTSNFGYFEKKKHKPCRVRLQNTCLLQCLKFNNLEHPYRAHVFTGQKHC